MLGSSSPRRQDILKIVQLPFERRIPDVDESQVQLQDPIEKVATLAKLKNDDLQILDRQEVILTADTVVSFNHRIFEKPNSKTEAFAMLKALSGTVHTVYTGVMLRSVHCERAFVEKTDVEFWTLNDQEINSYLETNDAYDKAGGYGIQSLGAQFVKKINGDYYNVMGLPISHILQKLKAF
ncbi:Maf family nucleotide pyrophosphatase [Amphibacillus jilinensis]|uniref:Maf family nucleotide pyrophosphatase n=1 Tax=Amphibacillus jilinensis TaxID=1216008 RepID=UPI00068652E6